MHEIRILSDEEFYERKKLEKRKSFLSELEQMSKSSAGSTSFSVKDMRGLKPEEKEKEKEEEQELSLGSLLSKKQMVIQDEGFGEFLTDLEEIQLSPIETITDDAITGFKLDEDVVNPDDNKYGKVFKKELAMLSEVLKDVKQHGNRMNDVLKKMNIVGGKGASSRVTGIPKGFTDLVEAYNSNNTTKIQVIKAMADLRSKQMDWNFKDKANHPMKNESVDNIADAYYKNIISGGTNNFIKTTSSAYQQATFDYDSLDFSNGDAQSSMVTGEEPKDPSSIDSLEISTGFNITQPIRGSRKYQDDDILGDEFGNIGNEDKNYEFVAYQYGDGKYQLGAIDEEGEVLEGIELPSDVDPDIVRSLSIRPGSNFVYDKYGRKYRVVEMGSTDASDVDDMDYPFNDSIRGLY